MPPLIASPTAGFLAVLLLGFLPLAGQEFEDIEIKFLDIRAYDNGFGTGIKFILTADQFIQRVTMENSYDLQTWQTNEIYPSYQDEGEGRVSFLSNPLGPTFYRAKFIWPQVGVSPNTVQVANGIQSPQITFGFSDRAFPFDPPELSILSSNPAIIPQENITIIRSTFINSIQVTPTFGGVGDVPIEITITAADGVTAKATLTVTVLEGGGIAPSISDFNDKVLERKFPGLNFVFSTISPSQRFIRNGEPGNWFYVLDPENGADRAILGFSYDEDNNDSTKYVELVNLTFVTDQSGNYEYIEVANEIPQTVSSSVFDLDAFPAFGAGASLTPAAFTRIAIGKNIINSAWTFDSDTRFNYTEPNGGPIERGNWSYVMTGEKTSLVTLTYDEDNNNPAVYREEVDMVWETLNSGSFTYREYFGTSLNNTFQGVFDLTD